MKYLKISLFILISSLSLANANTQSIITTTDVLTNVLVERSINENIKGIDKSAIREVSNYIIKNVAIPYEALVHTSELRVNLQVRIDKAGRIISKKILNAKTNHWESSIIKALSDLGQVSPVKINNIPVQQTLQIPIVFIR